MAWRAEEPRATSTLVSRHSKFSPEPQHLSFLFQAQPLGMLHLYASTPRQCCPPCSEPLHSAPHSHLRSTPKAPGVGEGGPLQDRKLTQTLGLQFGVQGISTCFIDGGLVYKWLSPKLSSSSESLTQVPNRSQNCQDALLHWMVCGKMS